MEKPVYLRQATWEFLQEKWQELKSKNSIGSLLKELGYVLSPSTDEQKMFEMVVEEPNRFLVHAGILDRLDLLENTVISDEIGLDFLIDADSLLQLRKEETQVTLIRLYDHKIKAFSRDQVKEMIITSDSFDQLD